MDPRPISRELHRLGDPEALDALHALLAAVWLEAPGLDARVRARLSTALGELVGNVVAHGRTPAGATPRIALSVRFDGVRLLAELRDDGAPLWCHPRDAALPDDPLAESGRGIALARAAMDRCEYARRDDENVWSLELSL